MNPNPPVPPAFPLDLTHILYLGAILVAAILLGIVVQRLLSRKLHRLTKGTATVWDDVLVESVKGVVVLWFFLIGLAVVLKLVPFKPELLVPVRRGLGVLGIVSAVRDKTKGLELRITALQLPPRLGVRRLASSEAAPTRSSRVTMLNPLLDRTYWMSEPSSYASQATNPKTKPPWKLAQRVMTGGSSQRPRHLAR